MKNNTAEKQVEYTVEYLEKLESKGELIGVFEGIPEDVYHAGPGVSRSTLFNLYTKGTAYLAHHKEKENRCFIVGSALHTLVLEPELFDRTYVVSPKLDMRKTKDKELYNSFQKKVSEQRLVVLDSSEYEQIKSMAVTINKNSTARQVLSGNKKEISVYAKCPETGILLKIRVDNVAEIEVSNKKTITVLCDLKTTKDASPSEFAKSFFSYGYDVQSGMYLDVYELATGVRPQVFAHAVVDKSEFWSCVYTASIEQVNRGRRIYKEALRKYKQALDNNSWFDVQQIQTPHWIDLSEVPNE